MMIGKRLLMILAFIVGLGAYLLPGFILLIVLPQGFKILSLYGFVFAFVPWGILYGTGQLISWIVCGRDIVRKLINDITIAIRGWLDSERLAARAEEARAEEARLRPIIAELDEEFPGAV